MVENELKLLLGQIQTRKCEPQKLEVKLVHKGCPKRLYDTLSAFSNRDAGGTIVFGLDETPGFKAVGVYNARELQTKVMESGEQMTPIVRPVFTVCEQNNSVRRFHNFMSILGKFSERGNSHSTL